MLLGFQNFIKSNNLFNQNSKLLVTVSGGIDSVALCHLLFKSGYSFSIAHCNFGLRGQESDQDELFVKKLAKKYKLEFFSTNFNTKEFATEQKVSTQMAARQLRYSWFNDLADTHNFDYILTAHHKNDLAETILLNLVRGTGISGLHGIKAQNGRLIRPLLFASKDDILDYIAQNNLSWREDSSNESDKYKRNFIRHNVIPLLKQLNPNFEETLRETSEKIAATEDYISEIVDFRKKELVTYEDGLIKIKIKNLEAVKSNLALLYEIIKDYNFNFPQTKSIISSLDASAGKLFESGTHILNKDRDFLIIAPKSNVTSAPIKVLETSSIFRFEDSILEFQKDNVKNVIINKDSSIACLDFDKLKFPLEIRKWKEGDWFFPLGMNQKKKISDFLIDSKVSLIEKNKTYVLSSGDSIVWIIGRRVDNRFKVTNNTSSVLLATLIKNKE